MTIEERVADLADLVEKNPEDHIYLGMLRAALVELVWPIARETRSYMAFAHEGEDCRGWVLMIPDSEPCFMHAPGEGTTSYLGLPRETALALARMDWRPGNGDNEKLDAITALGRKADPWLDCSWPRPTERGDEASR